MNDEKFDVQRILESVLQTGQEYVAKGQDYAEDKLNIPDAGPEREVMLDGMKKGAIASALLVGLLGTRGGRSLTGTALKLGGVAALGAAAYQAIKHWRDSDQDQSVDQLADADVEARGLLLIHAMVSAANADGLVDDQEQADIKHKLLEMHLPAQTATQLEQIIDAPLSAQQLAAKVSSRTEAGEVYLVSRLLIGSNAQPSERAYLQNLVTALGLSPEMVDALDSEID